MDVKDLGPLALVIVIGAIAISIGSTVMDNMYQTQCESDGYTYANFDNYAPDTYQCCSLIWSANTSFCNTTAYSLAMNVTGQGLEGLETFGSWIPLIALVVVASIVIGVIIRYMGGGRE